MTILLGPCVLEDVEATPQSLAQGLRQEPGTTVGTDKEEKITVSLDLSSM